MLKIFDCSNSSERPLNRKFGGLFENEFVGLLKKHSDMFCFEFVSDINSCGIIFTNDVFPSYTKEIQKPKVKRMDGVFWKESLKSRNEKYNQTALEADHVIFISNYSKDSYFKLYGDKLKSYSVVHHWVEKKFDYKNENNFNNIFFAMADNWNREEKRLNEVIKFSKQFPEITIYLIGSCESELPKNIISVGFLDTSSEKFLETISKCSGFLNLTYKDAATKTVCTALNYNIPVLYSNSGGVHELVKDFGIGIFEQDDIKFQENVLELDSENVELGYNLFKNSYDDLKTKSSKHNFEKDLWDSLAGYFKIFTRQIFPT